MPNEHDTGSFHASTLTRKQASYFGYAIIGWLAEQGKKHGIHYIPASRKEVVAFLRMAADALEGE